MSEQDKNKYIGVATLFNNFELKRFIKLRTIRSGFLTGVEP